MNSSVKASKILLHLQLLKAEIVFLQETHLCSKDNLCIERAWMGHLFHSKFSQMARGADIIIRKSVQFEPVTTISDSNGQFCYSYR